MTDENDHESTNKKDIQEIIEYLDSDDVVGWSVAIVTARKPSLISYCTPESTEKHLELLGANVLLKHNIVGHLK